MNRSTLLAAIGLAAAAASLGSATVAAAAPTPATTALRQRATVKWQNGKFARRSQVNFQLPGVGSGELVCRPDAMYIRMYPTDRTQETSLWSMIAQEKNGTISYAVKNARIYQYGTPTTPEQATGSGPSAQEGFNTQNDIEDSGQGLAFGLVSQRTALNKPAAPTAPLTSVLLNWEWSGFRGPKSGMKCHVTARFVTKMPAGTEIKKQSGGGLFQRPGPATNDLMLDWHGEQDAALGKTTAGPVQLPYLGTVSATCPTGRDSDAALIFKADVPSKPLVLSVGRWEGEGPQNYVLTTVFTDPITGLARVPLPTNGFLYIGVVGVDGAYAKLPVSSWRQTNDEKPAENFCEIAAQATTFPAPAPQQGGGDDLPN